MDINHVLFTIIAIPLSILGVYTSTTAIYFFFLSLFGFKKAERDYPIIEDKTRFLILVAAHNEEAVIGSTIKNLNKIDYDTNLYDIYIVNDNSTDCTGEICDKLGMKHVDTSEKLFEREGVGKPAGLQYALRFLGFKKLLDKYDCLMILDADNHVDSTILKELNSQYIAKNKPEAIQTYLDSKNSTTSLSLGYALGYVYTNRFFQLSKYRLGLPNAIGGTGFIVRLDYLFKHGGFKFTSLTEDLELEMEIVKDNGRILWNHFTRIYDEKPEKLKNSLKQRTRWAQGHWYVAFTKFFPFMKKIFTENGKIKVMDQLFYLFSMAKIVQLSIGIIGLMISFIYGLIAHNQASLYQVPHNLFTLIFGSSILTIFVFIYQYLICFRFAIRVDSKMDFKFFKMTISSLYYGSTYLISQFLGLLKWRNQNTWVKTDHSKTAIEHSNK